MLERPINNNSEQGKEKPSIKEGVDFVFEQNPELASIGTREEYSKYLESIFPESIVRDILYHGYPMQGIKDFKTEGSTDSVGRLGAMFGTKMAADLRVSNSDNNNLYSVIINIIKPKSFESLFGNEDLKLATKNILQEEGYDGVIIDYRNSKEDLELMRKVKIKEYLGNEYIVFNNSQIHILGSQKDVDDFKNFIESKK